MSIICTCQTQRRHGGAEKEGAGREEDKDRVCGGSGKPLLHYASTTPYHSAGWWTPALSCCPAPLTHALAVPRTSRTPPPSTSMPENLAECMIYVCPALTRGSLRPTTKNRPSGEWRGRRGRVLEASGGGCRRRSDGHVNKGSTARNPRLGVLQVLVLHAGSACTTHSTASHARVSFI
ncbi:hypothetical protein E2C01_062230 [Portunus trituberculatus]|uniref:Uncharacterized protein n=1 Tax=Portunus trituberculatus TaxID=210409 RepID=A0A5B7H7C6_PORTR|nr:hypothetical protein [Portunus trituberculatus]